MKGVLEALGYICVAACACVRTNRLCSWNLQVLREDVGIPGGSTRGWKWQIDQRYKNGCYGC